ncbi:MAG: glycosyltransferase family 2 protein [Candidatus Aminicenantes bacterium]|nr:glycosyltransferase family 2 protein [Candidatus Aminicenantes bacterium]
MTRLSFIIPVFNEKNTIEEIIHRVQEADLGLQKEIIVVDDGSTDGSKELLENMADRNLKILFHPQNRGKGAALRTGFGEATGDIICIQDADLEYDPRDYAGVLAPILDGRADASFGSRFLGGPHRVLYFWHYVGNRIVTTFCNMLANLNLTDIETCYKAIRRDILDRMTLRSNRFGFEPEITIKLARHRCHLYEVPISYSGREYAEGKKVTWRDGLAALFHIVRFRFFDKK